MLELLGGKALSMLVAAGGIVIALAAAWFKGRASGKAGERAKQQAERQKVNRKIDAVEDDVADNSPDENREALKKWSE